MALDSRSREHTGRRCPLSTLARPAYNPRVQVLLLTLGSHGDVHPFVGLALALRQRGHTPVIATNGHFETLIRGVGIDFLPIGSEQEYHDLPADKDLWSPSRSLPACCSWPPPSAGCHSAARPTARPPGGGGGTW